MRIHIAGLAAHISGRGMQRCAWCGEVLFEIDYANTMAPQNADGSKAEAPRPWKMGELIAVEGNGKWTIPDDGTSPLPIQFCGTVAPKLALVSDPTDCAPTLDHGQSPDRGEGP
jgi:hypothetical protein